MLGYYALAMMLTYEAAFATSYTLGSEITNCGQTTLHPAYVTTGREYVDERQIIDGSIRWAINGGVNVAESDGSRMTDQLIAARKSVNRLIRDLRNGPDDEHNRGHAIARINEGLKQVLIETKALSTTGQSIISLHQGIRNEGPTELRALLQLAAIYQCDQEVLLGELKAAHQQHPDREDYIAYLSELLPSKKSGQNDVISIHNALRRFYQRVLAVIAVLDPMINELTTYVHGTAIEASSHVFLTLRNSSTGNSYHMIDPGRVRFPAIETLIAKNVVRVQASLAELIPALKQQIEDFYEESPVVASTWPGVLSEVVLFQEQWTEMATEIHDWNADFWVNSEGRKEIIIHSSFLTYARGTDRRMRPNGEPLPAGTRIVLTGKQQRFGGQNYHAAVVEDTSDTIYIDDSTLNGALYRAN